PGQLTHAGKRAIRVPSNAQTVRQRPAAGYSYFLGLFSLDGLTLTPRAAARLGLHPTAIEANVQLNQKDPAAMGRLDEAVASLDPLAAVQSDSTVNPADHVLDQLRHALIAGAYAVLLVIGLSLLVAAAEQLRERRRVLAVLSAFGTRRVTLALSVLWQTAVPVAVGLALAVALGTALGAVLMEIVSLPVSFDWDAIILLTGAGALVVAAVTALTMPMLWRQMRPEALRVE
ncbi:MAG: FtsX-like permease family protein, partial [Solirubrobacteraceae bacterium]